MSTLADAHALYALAALTLVVAASVVMFVWNVRRSTTQRPHLELQQWARANQMTLHEPPSPSSLPPILPTLLPHTQWDRLLRTQDGTHTFARGISTHAGAKRNAAPDSSIHPSSLIPHPSKFHLLILRTPADWPPTALRPAHGTTALTDLLPDLRPYPSLPGTERFTTLGTTLHAARLLADSHLRGLLPPDLALLLHGPFLLLDFSHRPFDPLEFSRLLPLAHQLLQNLPQPSTPH